MNASKRSFRRANVKLALVLGMAILLIPLRGVNGADCLKLQPAAEMTCAELYYTKCSSPPKAVLVLCPGYNGNGLGMISQQAWKDFAQKENLGLVGVHFESPPLLLTECKGYYQASKGSGELLLDGIRQIYGRDLPVLIYGFSGGAHFTTRFVVWKPDRTMGWCALGAGLLDKPTMDHAPGIMACGEDDTRLGGALMFFKQGRALGNPWLWTEVPNTGHSMTPKLDDFVRDYFSALLHPASNSGMWVDVDLLKEISPEEVAQAPSLGGWLPNRDLFGIWKSFHEN